MFYKDLSAASWTSLSFIILLSVVLSNCNSEDMAISGCTDPEATNYNADANSDDGNCRYPRDLLLGQYTGPFDCPNDEEASDDAVTIRISEDPDSGKGIILSYMFRAGLFRFFGEVSGNQIMMLDIPMPIPGNAPFTLRGQTYENAKLSVTGIATVTGDILSFPAVTYNVYQDGQKKTTLVCNFEGTR